MRDQIVGVRRIEEALQRQVIHGGDLETNLLEGGAAHEDVLAQYRAQLEGLVPVSAWEVMHPDDAACRLLTSELAGRYRMLPVRIEGSTLVVAVAEPPPPAALDELSFLLSLDVVPRLTTEMRLAVGLSHAYGLDLAPRLRRLAEKLPPVVPSGTATRGDSATSRTEVARRSALPPMPTASAPATAAPAPSPSPTPALSSEEKPESEPRPPAPTPAPIEEPPRKASPWPAFAAPPTLTSLHGADLDSEETTIVPESTLLATKLATARPAAPVPPAENDSLAASVMALVAEPTTDAAPAAAPLAIEATAPPRADDTQRVPVEPRPVPQRKRPVLTPGVVAELLAEASDRDEILQLFLQVAHQAFEYVAIFVVQEDVADGRLAAGPGTTTEAIRQVSVPLDQDGLLASARATGSHYLGPIPHERSNHDLLRALGRESPVNALVVPVPVRSRVVLLLWADDGGRPIVPEHTGVLLATAPRVGAALEHLIVARKFAGYAGTDHGQRAGLRRPQADLARKKTHPATPVPAPVVEDVAPPSFAADPPPVVVPEPAATAEPVVTETVPWHAIKTPLQLVRPAPAPIPETSRLPTQPIGALTAPVASPAAATAEPFGQTVQVAVPPPAHSPAEALPADPADEDAEMDVSVGAWRSGEEGDEPSVDVETSEPSDDDVPTGMGAPAMRDTEPAPPPQSVQPPELGPVSGQTTGRKRSFPEAFRVDVVNLPVDGPRPEPSIIVDMGSNIEALVGSLMRGGEEADLAAAALQKIGEVALPSLIQRFPGPLHFDRHATHTRLPRVGDCGPLLRVLPTFRRTVVPYLLPLLGARDEDTRFYATFLFSEIQYPEAIPKLAPLLFDPDYQTRILAIDVLKGFRRFDEFDVITKELRETAWIASNSMARRRIAVEAIGELRDAGAVAMLIELVDVEDLELSDLCWKALILITRQDFGKVKKRWQAWLAKEGARHHIEWLIDALVHPSPELRLGASEELKRITREYFGYYYNLPKRDREKARKRYLEWWERIGRARFTGRS